MKVLIADDEKNIRETIKKYLQLENIKSDTADNGLSAKRRLERETYSCLVLDLKMPGMSGLELLEWIKSEGLNIPVIMISAYGEVRDAVNAMRLGARDYIVKPFDPEELLFRLRNIVQEAGLKNKIESETREQDRFGNLTGNNDEILKIKKLIKKVAPTPSTVLITGESGTGKEVVAQAVHNASKHASGPFVGVNIAGLPESLIESELFGYEKGAFTGAVNRKAGLFELAKDGSLFLDEIGDMPKHLQVKLLRVLQEKRIQRIGATSFIPVNPRIISATNRDLEKMVEEGEFREDLFYRLNVIRIKLPSLKERLEDLPEISASLIKKFNKEIGKNISGISSEALAHLQSYDFPGNIRELQNILERAYIFADENKINLEDLDLVKKNKNVKIPANLSLKSMEKKYIEMALQRWEGNRSKAADELAISRRTLINKIRDYSINY